MVPEVTTDDDRSPVIDAIIGGIVGVILSFIPFSPVIGGAVSGYLQNGTSEEGLKIGAGAGLVMLLPFVFIGFFLLMLMGLGGTPAAFAVVAFLALGMASLYTVGLSALGGYLGVYLRQKL